MTDKVNIKLSPHNAIAILSFLTEFFYDENRDDPELQAMHDAVDEYEESILDNITEQQVDDAIAEANVNELLGKTPKRRDNDDG